MDYKVILKAILEWNKKLFPAFVIILLVLVILKSLNIGLPYRLANLDYKLWFVAVSGLLVALNYYLRKNYLT